MVWVAISPSDCLELQFLCTPMKSTEYITVFSCSLLPFLRKNNDKKYVFQRDNVRNHGSRQSVEWLRSQSIKVLL